jgi:hypothetical protein
MSDEDWENWNNYQQDQQRQKVIDDEAAAKSGNQATQSAQPTPADARYSKSSK